jgi:hypothetical protein
MSEHRKCCFAVDGVTSATSRVDQRLSVAAGLTYKMNRNVQWKGEVRREQRSSNVPGEDYTANIFLLGLRLQD